MGTFSPKDPAIVQKIIKEYKSADKAIDKMLLSKMNEIVNVVYRTARARRPKISKEQHVAMGRSLKVNGKAAYRVSDPDAAFGVPVKTGDLQISIKKDVQQHGEKFTGKIYVDGPGNHYAAIMEFGNSRIRPRSFMRSAMNVNRAWIKKKWEEKPKWEK